MIGSKPRPLANPGIRKVGGFDPFGKPNGMGTPIVNFLSFAGRECSAGAGLFNESEHYRLVCPMCRNQLRNRLPSGGLITVCFVVLVGAVTGCSKSETSSMGRDDHSSDISRLPDGLNDVASDQQSSSNTFEASRSTETQEEVVAEELAYSSPVDSLTSPAPSIDLSLDSGSVAAMPTPSKRNSAARMQTTRSPATGHEAIASSSSVFADSTLPSESMGLENGPAFDQSESTGTESAGQIADDSKYSVVSVFYGTDRAVEERGENSVAKLAIGCIAAAILFALGIAIRRRQPSTGAAVCAFAIVVLVLTGSTNLIVAGVRAGKINEGVAYGNERGDLEIGICEVTIPATHTEGALESPSLLRLEFSEDQSKHVVLANVEPLRTGDFYAQMKQRISASASEDLLVFVHGYNVSFEDAARRTAQISKDLEFQGVPVFFSWPSQGGLVDYSIDETEVAWCEPDLKKFLLELRQYSGAKAINVVAHSMGNRALTGVMRDIALNETRAESPLFNEVVLAAPDIDADTFRRSLAPYITHAAKHITMYTSANDNALLASKKVHGKPRAGHSADGIVTAPGIETIDVSSIDTSMLGHSYIGSCEAVIDDIAALIHHSIRAPLRESLREMQRDRELWWVLNESPLRKAERNSSVR